KTLVVCEMFSQFSQIFRWFDQVSGELPYARAQLLGSIIWLYLDKGEFPRQSSDISNPAMKRFVQIYGGLLERGQYLPPSSYEVLFLSSAHTSENVDILANTLVDQIKEKLS
ncbi:MAG: hypothetical protein KKD56_05710, partial [Acidobacteria bacterium]|nr:hypothetical protein [Acidobacteriota bacterium]MBU1474483.1 hypothetical protein [Acidobacteriota bacterium]